MQIVRAKTEMYNLLFPDKHELWYILQGLVEWRAEGWIQYKSCLHVGIALK